MKSDKFNLSASSASIQISTLFSLPNSTSLKIFGNSSFFSKSNLFLSYLGCNEDSLIEILFLCGFKLFPVCKIASSY